ncbi:hypothetical protein H5368_13255 [Luteimonas sp. MC1782]|uniref:hypothetical protein n=1 Tax=Luteimonas sp. MC1782 TaxID=2760305 RepID=UPI0016042ABA|nr:hypothetical protein [Luteimonas sp. MC1782]MBB1473997.1 hypothetical protein [Luteimonas sp. MC1782]
MKALPLLVAAGIGLQPDVQYESTDGIDANLSYASETLRIGHDAMDIRNCASKLLPTCIIGTYFTFGIPDMPSEHWTLNGIEFTQVGEPHLRECTEPKGAKVIHSLQGGMEFSFYWSATEGLAGWSVSHQSQQGRWFKECWTMANNSFKPKPLRGSA